MQKLITLKEAARLLSISYEGLRRMVQANPKATGVFKVGRVYKLDLDLFKQNLTATDLPKKHNFLKLRNYYENESSYYNTLSHKTVKSHKKSLIVATEYFYKNEFTKENLYKFRDYLIKEKKLKEGTVKKYFDAISKMCEVAVNAGIIKDNIAFGMQKGLRTKQIERFLTKEERQRIREVANEDILQHIEFAIETGLRKGEQFGLTWDRIDLAKGEIYIIGRKNGKNLTLPISALALSILKSRSNLLRPFKNIQHYEFKEVLDATNIKNFRRHDLRHTFATWCIKGWHSWLNGKPLPLDRIKQL